MSGDCRRELTWQEWVERLPKIHGARKEYAALKAMVEKLTVHNRLDEDIKLVDEFIGNAYGKVLTVEA